MTRALACSAVAFACVLFYSTPGQGSIILDAHYVDPAPRGSGDVHNGGGWNHLSGAQTFTVETAGTLDHIELEVLHRTATVPPADLRISLYSLSGGVPSTSLAAVTVAPSSIPPLSAISSHPWTSFDFRFADLAVTPGDQLAIVLRTDAYPGYLWMFNVGTGYAGGTAMYGSDTLPWTVLQPTLVADFQFRVFVDDEQTPGVPEPSSMALWSLAGMVGLVVWRRRR